MVSVCCVLCQCLCPLYGVHGWHVTTVEGVGSRLQGYHPIQKRITDYHGSQCGYCTPGMVMGLYGSVTSCNSFIISKRGMIITREKINVAVGGLSLLHSLKIT